MEITIYLSLIVLTATMLVLSSMKIFQIFQLSSYRLKGVLNWFKITKFDYLLRYFALAFFSFVSMLVFNLCFMKFGSVKYLGFLFLPLFTMLFIMLSRKGENKVPLKFTPRLLRFLSVTALLYLAASFGVVLLMRKVNVISYAFLGALPMFIPLIASLAHYLVLPLEKLNNLGYRKRAMKKLEESPELIRIGITGSYGKTTAKNIMAKLLEKKFRVCYSPASYNTPMGISKVINNDLKEDDEVFIAEMGARNVGDIKELAMIVKPNFGLITAIGNQHLETFGNRENIKNTKFELIENLRVGGLGVFNGDSSDNINLFERCETAKYLTGAEGIGKDAYYTDVKFSSSGTEFVLKLQNESINLKTKLLGRHIPSLITMCAIVADNLGVSAIDIASAVEELQPVPHRLELIRQGDVTVIDDAYNSNTEGAHNALLVLQEFEDYKIVITPGLVELGVEEKQANYQFGKQIASSVDAAILIGSRADDISRGAIDGGMNIENIHIVPDLTSAMQKLKEIPGKKAVLFENDLPENY